MPFHNNQQQNNHSSPPYPHDNYYATANALYQAGQPVGAPTSQWTSAKSATSAGVSAQSYSYGNTNGNGSINSSRTGPSVYGHSSAVSADSSLSQYQTPRRTLAIGRHPEESYPPLASSAMSDVHHYGAPPAYGGDNFAIHLQQSTPQHESTSSSNPVPGSLQPGLTNRPGVLQANTAPGTIPTLPQISTQLQQPPMVSRSMTQSHTHTYSRSSPGSMDQPRYKPFSSTPEASKYSSTNSNYAPQTSSATSPYSPLDLASIRTRGDGGFSDGPLSPIVGDGQNLQYPTTSGYLAPWPIYAVDWCKWPPRANDNAVGKVAVGSYLEDNHNFIQILDARTTLSDSQGERNFEFIKTAEATHSYPVTRILWEPPSSNKQTTDLLATSGDHLRLWSLPHDPQPYQTNSITGTSNSKEQPMQKLSPLALLSNSKSPEHTAPITSLDWNVVSPSLIITSSIDTTCTIWDIPTLTAKTQLIAHDKEVFDVRFCAASVDVFVSCGADGSVRMFDLRSLEHSTIIYEPSDKQDKNGGHSEPLEDASKFANLFPSAQVGSPDAMNRSPTRSSSQTLNYPPPLLRIAASPHDAHLLATFSQDSPIIRVLDVRQPGQALLELKGHGASVNCIEWSSTQRGVLASGADDSCVLLWDLMGSGGNVPAAVPGQAPNQGTGQERGPSAVWECGFEVSNLSWAPVTGSLGVCGGRGFWGVQM